MGKTLSPQDQLPATSPAQRLVELHCRGDRKWERVRSGRSQLRADGRDQGRVFESPHATVLTSSCHCRKLRDRVGQHLSPCSQDSIASFRGKIFRGTVLHNHFRQYSL